MRHLAVVFLLGVFVQGSMGAPVTLEQGPEVASGSYTGVYLKKGAPPKHDLEITIPKRSNSPLHNPTLYADEHAKLFGHPTDNTELRNQQKVEDAKADLAFDAKLPSTSDALNDADEALNSMNDELDGESRLLSAIHPVSPQVRLPMVILNTVTCDNV